MSFFNPFDNSTSGLRVFDTVRAEYEDWLADVFVPTSDLTLIQGPRSALIFGEGGTGKTAIYRALIASSQGSHHLTVPWQPEPLKPGEQGDSSSTREQISNLFDACAMAILQHICCQPSIFEESPGWVKRFLTWFIRHHLEGDFEIRTGMLSLTLDDLGRAFLDKLSNSQLEDVFGADSRPDLIISQFVQTLQALQFQGAWILADGLEPWGDSEPDQLAEALKAFLAALSIFEQRGFVFKIFLPKVFEPYLVGAGGIARRRVDVYDLRWSLPQILGMIEKRLTFATDGKIVKLAGLCDDPNLADWLERCGETSPRGWLLLLRPLVNEYFVQLDQGSENPVKTKRWHELRSSHPHAKLRVDKDHRQVTVGFRRITDLRDSEYKILEYLYSHPGQTCSKSTLYYRAYRELDREPRHHTDPNWEDLPNYEGLIDTAIWRLRTAIEPGYTASSDNRKGKKTANKRDKRQTIFVITVHGEGYRLENAI